MAAYCREVEGRPNKSWIQCALFEKGSVNSEGIVTPKIKETIKFHRGLQTGNGSGSLLMLMMMLEQICAEMLKADTFILHLQKAALLFQ